MIKILFICHGNICRSTMAQYVLQDMVNKKGVADKFYIDSAATSYEEIGNGVHPEHYAIEASAAQDYEAFYEKEIRYRSLMGYPPVENLMAVLAACEDEALLEKACKYLKEYILRIKGQAQLNVIGPASPGVDKIKDIYRRVVYVKAPEYRTLVVLKDRMEQYIEINSGFQKMRIQFDFNPMNL